MTGNKITPKTPTVPITNESESTQPQHSSNQAQSSDGRTVTEATKDALDIGESEYNKLKEQADQEIRQTVTNVQKKTTRKIKKHTLSTLKKEGIHNKKALRQVHDHFTKSLESDRLGQVSVHVMDEVLTGHFNKRELYSSIIQMLIGLDKDKQLTQEIAEAVCQKTPEDLAKLLAALGALENRSLCTPENIYSACLQPSSEKLALVLHDLDDVSLLDQEHFAKVCNFDSVEKYYTTFKGLKAAQSWDKNTVTTLLKHHSRPFIASTLTTLHQHQLLTGSMVTEVIQHATSRAILVSGLLQLLSENRCMVRSSADVTPLLKHRAPAYLKESIEIVSQLKELPLSGNPLHVKRLIAHPHSEQLNKMLNFLSERQLLTPDSVDFLLSPKNVWVTSNPDILIKLEALPKEKLTAEALQSLAVKK